MDRLSDAKMSERFMGGAHVEDHLDASDWCSFNLPRIHVPEEMESMEPEASARAEEIVKVEDLFQMILFRNHSIIKKTVISASKDKKQLFRNN